jgi:hypothetical protein
MNSLRISAGITLSIIATSNASAYSVWQGRVGQIFFSGTGNFAFRAYADAATPLTGCRDGFAYIETSQSNYQVYVSSITTAFTTGKTLHLTYSPDAQGYCVIAEGAVDAQ